MTHRIPSRDLLRDYADGGTCAALTVRRKPCRNAVFPEGQFWSYEGLQNETAVVSDADHARIVKSFCPLHDALSRA